MKKIDKILNKIFRMGVELGKMNDPDIVLTDERINAIEAKTELRKLVLSSLPKEGSKDCPNHHAFDEWASGYNNALWDTEANIEGLFDETTN